MNVPAHGERVVYYRGLLARDTQYRPEIRELQQRYLMLAGYKFGKVWGTGSTEMWMQRNYPQVLLFQRRLKPGQFEYIAVGIEPKIEAAA